MADRSQRQPDLSRRTFNRILLVKPSSLGDIVHALPVLHGLRRRYPGATIDWLVASSFASLLRGHPEIDELVIFDRKRLAGFGRNLSATTALFAFLRRLRAGKYDLVIDLQGLFRSGFFSRATGAGVRLGFRTAREGARFFYTHQVCVDDPDAHAVDRNYLVARVLGFDDVPICFTPVLPESAWDEVHDPLKRDLLSSDALRMVVVPGGRWETKVWLPQRFAETIDRVAERTGARGILVGSPDETALCEQIANKCESDPVNLAGKTNLRQLAVVLKRADVVLCHDSAAMHFAVAFRRPLVCLVGPTNPHRTGPYNRPNDVVRLNLDCSPCYLRRLDRCPHGHRCMRDINVGRVVTAVERAMNDVGTA